MKAIINSSKRIYWFKALMAFLTCLLFLIPPSCEKDVLNQDSLPNMDKVAVSASATSSTAKMYWEHWFSKEWGGPGAVTLDAWINPPWYKEFGNYVLKVQSTNISAKISALQIRIDGVLILTEKGLARDYYVAKTLRSLAQNAHLTVSMEGDQGSNIHVWIEGTLKIGTAYGKHLYYKTNQQMSFDEANGYSNGLGAHLVIINDAKENNFLLNLFPHDYDRNFYIGLADRYWNNQEWHWVNNQDNPLCRVLIWNGTQCPGPPDWCNSNCLIINDYGYNNWMNCEPNNGNGVQEEDVAAIGNDGRWYDLPSYESRNFVIEWDYIPSSGLLINLFRNEYPWYPFPL